jgi:hypothetical protein
MYFYVANCRWKHIPGYIGNTNQAGPPPWMRTKSNVCTVLHHLQFLVDRVVPVGNGCLLLNLRNAITNQRRNSIQMTPTRTKLAKPKTAFTMVIMAAFYILLTHICSDYYLLPSCQSRGSNAFSPCQEPPLAGRQKSEFLNAGCWHTTNITQPLATLITSAIATETTSALSQPCPPPVTS